MSSTTSTNVSTITFTMFRILILFLLFYWKKSISPQSYSMSLRSGNWVLMLHWIRWREPKSGVTWVESVEMKAACLLLRDGGGWQECIEIGGPSTVGIAKVNLKMRTISNDRKVWNLFFAKALASLDVNVVQKKKPSNALYTFLWCHWAVPACSQCCGWPPSQPDSETSSCFCSATVHTNSCFGPSESSPPVMLGQPVWEQDQGEKSRSPKPPGHTRALLHSGIH